MSIFPDYCGDVLMVLEAILQGAGFCLGFAIMAVLIATVVTFIGMLIQKYEE